jgi:hypothetical protein
MKILDRYSLLCASVALILFLTIFITNEEPIEEKDIVGIVHDIKETVNGYTFSFEDSKGEKIKCFFKAEPCEYSVYMVKGTFSDDGSMLFVSNMKEIYQNEF